jgi:transposase InsO family protein
MATKSKSKKRPPRRKRYPAEFKVRAVKLHLEEGYPTPMVAAEMGIGQSTLGHWIRRYRDEGEKGLEPRVRGKGRPQVDPAAKAKAVELKRKDPEVGSRRISQVLRRVFLLQASPETVRKTLKEEGLVEAPKRKPQRNPSRPRFFERAQPNQMWQSDIFTFRLGGRSAYVIGYLDDYSRYVTSLGMYRSQTAEHVIEVYRRGIAEYGVPKEMLTDNGRQYVNWRGTTRFEAELKKERVKHIRSRPHHPMTLGKIERFWKSLFTEFLCRVQFDSFEEAQERLRLWVKYYNHKRPHQGIGGLCPADRFYEIDTKLRHVIERGMAENVLERALRGRPRKPFYMVGRMGEQSVVIRAEKGKVKMLVDDEETDRNEELIYDVDKSEDEEAARPAAAPGVRGEGEVRSGAGGVVGTADAHGGVPRVGDPVAAAQRMAEGGDGSADEGVGTAPGSGTEAGVEPASPDAAGEDRGPDQPPQQTGETAGNDTAREPESPDAALREQVSRQVALLGSEELPILLELLRECTATGGDTDHGGITGSGGEEEGGADPEGTYGDDERRGRGPGTGGEPQDLLQVGAPGPGGDARGARGTQFGSSFGGEGRGEGGTEGEGPGAGARTALRAEGR